MDNSKKNAAKADTAKAAMAETKPKDAAKPPAPTAEPTAKVKVKVPPMFRPIDWFALLVTFLSVWAVYLWTLAPELTLEDSGELCTGSYYAGIPHPPGYPFWAIYSWIWTVIVPIGNVAWRVEVGQSFASAMGCGLLALMVSRGGSMMIEGIEELKTLDRRWENLICIVSGVAIGTLFALGAYMWKESVVINRISIFGVPWLLAMIALIMRWMHATDQRWYLYLAMLVFGWIATIHQSLILGVLGVEILIAFILPKLGRDLFGVNALGYLIILMYMAKGSIPALNAMTTTEKIIFHTVGIISVCGAGYLISQTGKLFTEWKSVILMGVMWGFGVCVYFYMPISCMTDPPMQWGYPRTVEGFFHALSRGQYANGDANIDPRNLLYQMFYLATGLSESFSWVFMTLGILPFLFLFKMRARERGWLIGLASIYFLLAVQLVIVLSVTPDRSTSELNKVFFTASHAVFALMIGYGMALLTAYIATHYAQFRRVGFYCGGVALLAAIYSLVDAIGKLFFGQAGQMRVSWLPHFGFWDFLAFGPDGQFGLTSLPHWIAQGFAKNQYGSPVLANLLLIGVAVVFILALLTYNKNRGPVAIVLALFLVAPVWSGLSHWYKCEQRNHYYGYWFGHDMFTPPFEGPDGKFSYDNKLRAEMMKDPAKAKLIYPEMTRNAILFGGTDPGRFCPTYIIFCESFIPHRCQPKQDQNFDRRDVYIITQNALADGTYLDYLRAQYNRSLQTDPPFFSRLFKYLCSVTGIVPKDNIVQEGIDCGSGESGNRLVEGVANLLDGTLDKWFTAIGQRVEARRRAEGVYPPTEIHIPTPMESAQCFQEFAQEKNLATSDGRLQISGQNDVMYINGLLCKVIFDNDPTNDFFVEESFPLDWMYPYETPFGVIMQINRQPLAEIPDEVFQRDHAFWSKYSERLCGNFITYDTTVQQIADFVDHTYVHNNYNGFIGSRSFIRDEDAQKAFSKLRSSQAGVYAWRCDPRQCPAEYRQKSAASQQALIREADFAFKQAFAFCPYSPEAVFRYVNFLLQYGRFDDAILVCETCQKLDPFNDMVAHTIDQLKQFREQNAGREKVLAQVSNWQEMARTNPDNYTNLITLGQAYMEMQQTNEGIAILSQALKNPKIDMAGAQTVAKNFGQIAYLPGFEAALRKIISLSPAMPEPHYNLADVLAVSGRGPEAMSELKVALDLNSKRLATNPTALNLLPVIRSDANLNSLRSQPEFQQMVGQ